MKLRNRYLYRLFYCNNNVKTYSNIKMKYGNSDFKFAYNIIERLKVFVEKQK